MNQNKIVTDPTLIDAFNLLKKDILLSVNCHAIGTVRAFDPVKQTVSATINYKKTYFQADSKTGVYSPVTVDYPTLVDCPVIVMQGGNAALTFPIAAGDPCLILFNDRDIDNWFQSGQVGPVATPRLHSFSDGIALVGLRPSSSPIANYDPTRAVLRYGDTLVGVGASKVQLENATYTLEELLQELITDVNNLVSACAAITVTGVLAGPAVSGPPANAATITAVSTSLTATANKIAGLLE